MMGSVAAGRDSWTVRQRELKRMEPEEKQHVTNRKRKNDNKISEETNRPDTGFGRQNSSEYCHNNVSLQKCTMVNGFWPTSQDFCSNALAGAKEKQTHCPGW